MDFVVLYSCGKKMIFVLILFFIFFPLKSNNGVN